MELLKLETDGGFRLTEVSVSDGSCGDTYVGYGRRTEFDITVEDWDATRVSDETIRWTRKRDGNYHEELRLTDEWVLYAQSGCHSSALDAFLDPLQRHESRGLRIGFEISEQIEVNGWAGSLADGVWWNQGVNGISVAVGYRLSQTNSAVAELPTWTVSCGFISRFGGATSSASDREEFLDQGTELRGDVAFDVSDCANPVVVTVSSGDQTTDFTIPFELLDNPSS